MNILSLQRQLTCPRGQSLSRRFAPNWTPAQIPGLALWLDAADASTITLNGSDVSQWNDKSGNAYHLTQPTAALQPRYEATGMNGKPALNNLIGRRLQTEALPVLRNVNGATMVAVARFTTPLVNPTNNGMLVFVSNGTGVGSTRFGLNANPTGTRGTYSVSGRRLDADAFATVSSPTAITSDPVIWMGNANYATAQANSWLNGVPDIVSATFQTAGNTSDTNALGVSVFSSPSGSVNIYDNTRLSEAIIINTTLSTANRQLIEGYLAWKWGGI